MSLTADDLNYFLCPFFSCLIVDGAFLLLIHLMKKAKASDKEKGAAKAIRSFLPTIYPEAAIADDHATFVHGRLRCTLSWRYVVAGQKGSSDGRSTVLSFQIPDWMAQVLAGKDFTIDYCLPSQYIGLPEAEVPQEFTDFVHGRLKGRVPGAPFVNVKVADKAFQEALRHDLATCKIVNAADMSSLRERNSYALKGTLFSAELPGFICSKKTFQTLVKRTMAMLKRAYLVACQVDGVQPVDWKTFGAYFNVHGKFLDRPDDSADAIVDEVERELAQENAADGDDGDAMKALGDGARHIQSDTPDPIRRDTP